MPAQGLCTQTIWLPGLKTRSCGRPATTSDYRGQPRCRKCNYDEYINSSRWESTQRCNTQAGHGKNGQPTGLNVHHLSYDRLGDERDEDLVVLCRSCHAQEHGRRPE